MSIESVILLIFNERLYKSGEIDQDTKEKIEMEIISRNKMIGNVDSN